MSIYVNRDNQQSGPFEEADVIAQLRSGSLSPNDMGIRRGDASWQRLGEMFPDVGREAHATPAMSTPPSAPAGVNMVSPPSAKKGGCLKGGLMGLGALLLLLGIVVAAGSRFIPSTSCDRAQADEERIDKLQRDIEKARSDFRYDRIGPLTLELKEATAGHEVSKRYCDSDKFRDNMIGIAGGVVAVIGLLMAVVGLFVGRGKG